MASALDVSCPSCAAAPGTHCKNPHGATRLAHPARTGAAVIVTEASPKKHTVVITRSQFYPEVARPGSAWWWIYNYTIDGGPVCQYGSGLTSLRRQLREKYGARSVVIVETWKQQPSNPTA